MMAESDDFFEEFEPHSRYKLLILENYFETWGRKMLMRPGAGSTVVYVDACAGRGMDDEGNHGSPVIAARAAAKAQQQLSEMLNRPITLRVLAIEKDDEHFAELQRNLAPFGGNVTALHGTLGDHIDDVEAEFGDTPTLYFIDPFGLDPLDGALVKRCLVPPKNEALILFADQAALRHFGAAVSQQTKVEKKLEAYDSQGMISLFPELDAVEREELAQKAKRSKRAQNTTRENAIRILDAAFQSHEWFNIVQATPRAGRRNRFVQLYLEFLERCGAAYRLAIPVIKEDATRAYTLVHASKSPKGYTTMKKSVEYALKHGPLSEEIVDLIRWEMGADLASVAVDVRNRYAGKTALWAYSDDRSVTSISRDVLEGTPIMPGELTELRAMIGAFRDKSYGRTYAYTFPPSPAN
jgi:three-Cys-motif partner protein